jgi:CBS domain-containing protein
MVTCPYCGDENIDGADVCEQCQQSLEFLSKPKPGSDLERSLLTDRVSALAPRQPVVVDASTPVAQVLGMLIGHSIGCVVVVNGEDEIVGIFSERDALTKIGADAEACAQRPIADFMTAGPETIEYDAKIAFALSKMDIGGYRHMPVVAGGRIRSVISIRDILDYITAHLMAEVE